MSCKGVVAAVVGRHSHNSTGTVTCKNIVAYIYRYTTVRNGVDGIRTRKYSRHSAVGYAFAFGAFAGLFQILVDLVLLVGGGNEAYIFALGSQHHKCNTVYRIGTGGEYIDSYGGFAFGVEHHLGTFGASYPVALRLFDALTPIQAVQAVEKPLCISRHTQTPLFHHLLHHRITATDRDTVLYLVVGKDSAELFAPIDCRLCQICYTVVHKHLTTTAFVPRLPLLGIELYLFSMGNVETDIALPLETLDKLTDRACLLCSIAIIRVEHTYKCPLCPFVVVGIAGTYLSVPIERKAYLIELLPVTTDILVGSNGRVLPRLYGVLLGGQPVGIVSHRVKYIEALLPLVAGVYIGSDISERMPHVQACSRRVGEHIEYIILRLIGVYPYAVGLVVSPALLPTALYISEIVFH